MKILYALPATGNGHISRAIELYPILLQYGEVDFLVSGCNSHLAFPFPIKYKSKGISLFYNTHGAIDYYRFLQNIQVSKLLTEMRSLPYTNMIVSSAILNHCRHGHAKSIKNMYSNGAPSFIYL
ncbi:MAG: hypothetical protein IPG85_05655 [Bacteroidetes bacterium]|nr:hypothetical protein [Bacteroidota bacterium]